MAVPMKALSSKFERVCWRAPRPLRCGAFDLPLPVANLDPEIKTFKFHSFIVRSRRKVLSLNAQKFVDAARAVMLPMGTEVTSPNLTR
jgi:hypothetical protein